MSTQITTHEYITVPIELLEELKTCLRDAERLAFKHECKYEGLNSDLCLACSLWSRIRYTTFKLSQWLERK